MGSGKFDSNAYRSYSASTVGKTTDEVFTNRTIDSKLSPLGVKYRESRDSADNPNSLPIIVALDVTGSMGMIADVMAREGLGTLFNNLLEGGPVKDPHLMFMGIGDITCDKAPLQVSQFEADVRIIEQLALLWLEKGGGGNWYESYNLPWYFGAFHTVSDAYEKRGKRGYLFTVGDEGVPSELSKSEIQRATGDTLEQAVLSNTTLLELVQRQYHVYHIIVEEGSHARMHLDKVQTEWRNLMGQNVISLSDHKKLAETIVGVIAVTEGMELNEVTKKWSDSAQKIVKDAVGHLPKGRANPPLKLGAPK